MCVNQELKVLYNLKKKSNKKNGGSGGRGVKTSVGWV